MMGQRGGNQERLFYSFSLEDHIPSDHLLRGVDRFLDLSDLRKHLAEHYSNTGRPSIESVQPIGLRDLHDEVPLLSERADSQDHSQRS